MTDPRTDIESVVSEMERYARTLDAESSRYWEFHRKRFEFVTRLSSQLIHELERAGNKVERILDIGNSFQTMMINRIRPDLQVDTLGFQAQRYTPNGITKHLSFDLNDAYYPDRWIALEDAEKYDLILFLEVVEHLYTAPEQVLGFLHSLLKPHGLIVIQTPNAAALISRLRLLFGKHPYELIRKERENPGHFREYTKHEITNIAQQSGFEIKEMLMMDYFPQVTFAERICRGIAHVLPGTFKTGITVILRRVN